MSYDYLPYSELRKWQPRDVMRQIIAEANELADQKITISIATNASSEHPPQSVEEFKNLTYEELGTQTKLNLNKLGKLWHSLSGVALHVSLPESKSDAVCSYGSIDIIRTKVQQALCEFERLVEGTMIIGGSGSPANECYSFKCTICDLEIRRNSKHLDDRAMINCTSPNCMESYLLEKVDGEIEIRRLKEDIACQSCGVVNQIPHRYITKFRFGQIFRVGCRSCSFENEIVLKPFVKMVLSNSDRD